MTGWTAAMTKGDTQASGRQGRAGMFALQF